MDLFFVLIKVDGPITVSGLITRADQGAYKYKWQFTVFTVYSGMAIWMRNVLEIMHIAKAEMYKE